MFPNTREPCKRNQSVTIPTMNEVTRLLDQLQQGDRYAAARLLPLVYDELRKLAAVRMRQESPDHLLQPTALVHEAYLRLIGDQKFDGRGHFFAAAAEAMRRVLVDHCRGFCGDRREIPAAAGSKARHRSRPRD